MPGSWERFLDPFVKRKLSGSLKGTEEGTRMTEEEFEDYVTEITEEIGMLEPSIDRDVEGRVIGHSQGYGGHMNITYVDPSVQIEPQEFGKVNLDSLDPVLKVNAEMPYSQGEVLDVIQDNVESKSGYEGELEKDVVIGHRDSHSLQDYRNETF